MKLLTLTLENFRNHQAVDFSFSQLTVIIGKNTSGKTNILEAIRLLSIGKSFRARFDKDMITFDHDTTRILALAEINHQKCELSIAFNYEQKKVLVAGVPTPLSQLVGKLKTVIFALDDLDFINGPPRNRRRFLDYLLSQKSVEYIRSLLDLNKILKHRNALLERINFDVAGQNELKPWDEQLVEVSSVIQAQRQQAVKEIEQKLSNNYHELANRRQTLSISYQPSSVTLESLLQTRRLDLKNRATSCGPQRDDLEFLLNGKSLGQFGSRGERRLAVLALKQSEIDLLTSGDEKPILLLDDVFSELDESHQKQLMELFIQQQTILTTTILPKIITQLNPSVIEL